MTAVVTTEPMLCAFDAPGTPASLCEAARELTSEELALIAGGNHFTWTGFGRTTLVGGAGGAVTGAAGGAAAGTLVGGAGAGPGAIAGGVAGGISKAIYNGGAYVFRHR